ncbi:tail fiber domain-containing protein [Pedobacter cryophilus]|uniref:Peptidase S74 domain-containing protein n=1 Tax=Pedobacter cryophilus TaxID=2571271 RepID=A0A4V5NXQ1_9SPHI|nr:tail fiber domain-containing protein [Pedobacter cryophilus]TKB99053.1 hypothetical protein FA046_08040 [Pedobacter cryophilus]
MKKNLLSILIFNKILCLILLVSNIANAQTPDTLLAVRDNLLNSRMSVHTNGGFLLGGTYDGDAFGTGIVANGAGTRLMWYPQKAAFRVGGVSGTQWDSANIGDYSFAAGEGCRASAAHATAFGLRCVAAQQSSFAVGEDNTATGAASVAMGYHAHTNARQGSFVFADRSTVDTIRASANHTANWRVSGGFRIFSSSNLSTGVTIQSGASVSNWGQSNAVISTSTGAYLSTGGVWTNTSDVNKKHLFKKISNEEILQKLRALDIKEWSYKFEDESIRHIGPTAQDFHAAFNLGTDTKSIGTIDADGILMAATKALEMRTKKQSDDIDKLITENLELRKRLDILEKHTFLDTASISWPLVLVLLSLIIGGIVYKRYNFIPSSTKK